MNATLTLAMLREANACPEGLTRFKKLFGSEVEITEELCLVHSADCSWNWAGRLLSPARQEDYDRACISARKEYYRACSSTWEDYDRACALAEADHDRTLASAWAKAWIADHTQEG